MDYALIEKYGGSHGLRDPGALEAALYRPRTGYYADVIAEAAALFESLVQNHPFIDGNKRVAFAVTQVFLNINGRKLQRTSVEVHDFMMSLFRARAFRLERIEPWLREHAVKRATYVAKSRPASRSSRRRR